MSADIRLDPATLRWVADTMSRPTPPPKTDEAALDALAVTP